VTMDPTAYHVASLSAVSERMLGWLQLGGPVVMVLLAMSVLALTIVIIKLWQFRALRIGDLDPAREAAQLYCRGRPDAALALAGRTGNPVAGMLAQAMRGQLRSLPEAKVREEVIRHAGDVLESLRAGLRPLEVIASLAPLLGLFGTVLGMIEAFRRLEQAGNQADPAVLSGGIWEALLTTAVGLAVAIPVVAVLNWLERRVDRLEHEMDSIVTRVFTVDLTDDPEKEEGHASTQLRDAAPHTVE
jgi:biopolymer transport protein ExbB